MYARIERINLSQGFAELAEELADRIAPIMRRQPGLQAMSLLSDESSGEYIILTHWDTLEQVNTYERSPDEWRVRDIISQHITAVPLIEVYQIHDLPTTPMPAPLSEPTTAPLAAPMAEIVPAPAASVATTSQAAQRASMAGVATAAPADGQCPATHPVKGNHSRAGDFIYHVPGSQFYDRTEAEVCFASATEAEAAGFRAPR
jgi:heme-degrading monooxygenase HmoA